MSSLDFYLRKCIMCHLLYVTAAAAAAAAEASLVTDGPSEGRLSSLLWITAKIFILLFAY